MFLAGGRDSEEYSDDRADRVREDGDCPTRGEDVSGALYQGAFECVMTSFFPIFFRFCVGSVVLSRF